jgi:hypothetical protein
MPSGLHLLGGFAKGCTCRRNDGANVKGGECSADSHGCANWALWPLHWTVITAR